MIGEADFTRPVLVCLILKGSRIPSSALEKGTVSHALRIVIRHLNEGDLSDKGDASYTQRTITEL